MEYGEACERKGGGEKGGKGRRGGDSWDLAQLSGRGDGLSEGRASVLGDVGKGRKGERDRLVVRETRLQGKEVLIKRPDDNVNV